MLKKRHIIMGFMLLISIGASVWVNRQNNNGDLVELAKPPVPKLNRSDANASNSPSLLPGSEPYPPLIRTRQWPLDGKIDLMQARVEKLMLPSPSVSILVNVPPPKPVAPPLPFIYTGKMIEEDRVVIFINKGDRNYSIRGSEVIEGIYAVQSIDVGKIVFKYLPLGEEQTLIIGDRN